jgi:hypothetical protein
MNQLAKITSEKEFQQWLEQVLLCERTRLREEALARELSEAHKFGSPQENYNEGDTAS